MAIAKQGAQSLNAQVRDHLLGRIRSGEFGVGHKIPSLRALMDELNVAEGTVHSAIRELQHDGILESTTGRGTFVKRIPDDAPQSVAETLDELRTELADLKSRVERLEADS